MISCFCVDNALTSVLERFYDIQYNINFIFFGTCLDYSIGNLDIFIIILNNNNKILLSSLSISSSLNSVTY